MKKYRKEVDLIRKLRAIAERVKKDKSLGPAFRVVLTQLSRDIDSALSFWNHRPAQTQLLKPSSESLQIGGGSRYIEGFVNLDIFPPADIIWDSRYGLPFPSESFSFVFSEHFLEHIDFPVSVRRILKETYRVLRPGGKIFIAVPNGGKAV
ncbi:MAG: methyltransferase domain-containing protein, partial [Patescibacteria group bacterium]